MDKVRENLLAFTKQLKHDADAARLSPQANDEEKAALQQATELLVESVAKLINIVDQHAALLSASVDLRLEAKSRLADIGYAVIGGDADVLNLVFATSVISNLALNNPVTRRAMIENIQAMRAERTAAPLKAKKDKVARCDEVIRNHADQVRAKHPDWTRWYIAGQIEKSVGSELKPLTPTRGTIYRRLGVMNFV